MILLRDDDKAFCLKDLFGPVHALISRKSGVIHKDAFGGHALFNRIALHGIHLVIIIPSMVAAHNHAIGNPCLIDGYARVKALFQHPAQAPVRFHLRPQH